VYQLYLPVENIDHSRTKTKHPQTNGFASVSTKLSRTNSTAWRFARSSILLLINYKPISIAGGKST